MDTSQDQPLDSTPTWAIDVQELSKIYETTLAVDRLDLKVAPGSILGLLGPNGAGKTTSMRCLAGIIPATYGRIIIAGNDLKKDPQTAKQHLSFVPDTPHLFDYLSVEEHLRFAARIYQVADADQRIESLLKEFDLVEKRRHLPQALSRGMKQKVAICLGFLHAPRVIFLDEPLTGLDPIGIRRMKDSINLRAREGGAAILVSSHQLELVEEICDEILILKEGRSIIQGSLASIRQRLTGLPDQVSLEDIFFHVTLVDQATREQTTQIAPRLPSETPDRELT